MNLLAENVSGVPNVAYIPGAHRVAMKVLLAVHVVADQMIAVEGAIRSLDLPHEVRN